MSHLHPKMSFKMVARGSIYDVECPAFELNGDEVRLDSYLTEEVVIRPQDKYVEYGPEDDWWLRKFGLLQVEVRPIMSIWRIQDYFINFKPDGPQRYFYLCHPYVGKQLLEELKRRDAKGKELAEIHPSFKRYVI